MNGQIASCTIATAAYEFMLAHARRATPDEACGLLIGREAEIIAVVATQNVAHDRRRNFEIDPAALLHHHRESRVRGEAVIGHYHSHPNGSLEPSKTDAACASENGQLWLLVGHDRATAWKSVRGGALHGRFAPVEMVML